jgi:glycosyltransferase involved in cell wall biosynthesis
MNSSPPRKLKVAHVITLLELGGAQQNTLYTVQHLDPEAFEPVLICGRGALLDQEALAGRCPVHFIGALVRPVNPWLDVIAFFQIWKLLKRLKPDIVHTHSAKAGILGRWAARLAGVPVILQTYHGFGFNREQSPWAQALYHFLERRTARFSHALIVVSKTNQEEALSLGIGRAEQYRLIRSGVPLDQYRSLRRTTQAPAGISLLPQHRLIVTVGPFKPQKNLLDFIRAAADVHSQEPEARFLIVGDGELRFSLEKEITRLNLEAVFFIPGWRRDIPDIFSRTDVFVLTSLWEGLPRALVEAMAAGLPCVANAVDGVQDVLVDGVNGFRVAPKNPQLTAERILRLLKNPEEAAEIGRKAREFIGREFDITHMVHQQEELYKTFRS